MPPSDQEPRYQLVDSNGNVVGSLFGDGSGNVVIADETDTQTTFDANGITTPALEADDIQINDNIYYAEGDADLDTALNNANDGDLIILGPAEYTSDRTISDQIRLSGTKGDFGNVNIDCQWSLNGLCVIENITLVKQSDGDVLTVDNERCVVDNVFGRGAQPQIQVNANEAILTRLKRMGVTFASGTSTGIVDSSVDTTVTDNGTNTVGDIP